MMVFERNTSVKMWTGQGSVQATVHTVIRLRVTLKATNILTDEQPLIYKRVPYCIEFRQLYEEQSSGAVTILQRTRQGRPFRPSVSQLSLT
jgi:hypothetical protein